MSRASTVINLINFLKNTKLKFLLLRVRFIGQISNAIILSDLNELFIDVLKHEADLLAILEIKNLSIDFL